MVPPGKASESDERLEQELGEELLCDYFSGVLQLRPKKNSNTLLRTRTCGFRVDRDAKAETAQRVCKLASMTTKLGTDRF